MQNALQSKSSEPVTTRNLTLTDLLHQLNHPSSTTRKDALMGLRELVHAHPHLARQKTNKMLLGPIKCVMDMERPVRRTLALYLADLVPLVSEVMISPFFATAMVYTSSAMTHVLEDIRLDALKVTSILLQFYPRLCLDYGTAKILPNLIQLLSNKAEGGVNATRLNVAPTSQLGLSSTRMQVLEILYRFIQLSSCETTTSSKHGLLGINPVEVSTRHPYLERPLQSMHASSFFHSITPMQQQQQPQNQSVSLFQFNLTSPQSRLNLLVSLQPILIEIWIECSSSIFTASPRISQSDHLRALDYIIKILSWLWSSLMPCSTRRQSGTHGEEEDGDAFSSQRRTAAMETVKLLERHVLTHFVFGEGKVVSNDVGVQQVLTEMNLAMCQMCAVLVSMMRKRQDANKSTGGDELMDRCVKYLQATLASTTDGSKTSGIRAEHVATLAQTVDIVLKCTQDHDEAAELFTAFVGYHLSCPFAAKTRLYSFGFIAESMMTQLGNQHVRVPNYLLGENVRVALRKFVLALPRFMCAQGAEHQEVTEKILRVLLVQMRLWRCGGNSSGTRCVVDENDEDFWKRLQQSLIPFFHVVLKDGREVFGPYGKLEARIQRISMDLVQQFPREQQIRLQQASNRAATADGHVVTNQHAGCGVGIGQS